MKLKEIQDMFWALTLNGGNRYTQTVETSFHLSMAALEPSSDFKAKDGHTSVMIHYRKSEFVLCTLKEGDLYQQPLDLQFTEGEVVTFFLKGPATIHLTGYLIEDEIDDNDGYFEDEEGSSDMSSDDAPELLDSDEAVGHGKLAIKNALKRKKETDKVKKKKMKLEDYSDDSDSDDSDFDESKIMKEFDEGRDVDGDDDDDDDDEEDDFDDDDDDFPSDDDMDSDEDEENDVKFKTPKTQEKKPKNTPVSNKKKQTPKSTKAFDDDDDESEVVKLKTPKTQEKKKTPKSPKNKANGNDQTPKVADASTPADGSQKKKKKKKKNKNKDDAVSEEVKETKVQTPKTPKPSRKVLVGGTILDDLKVGHGPEAKEGKMVHVYYAGKLQQSGKQFDSKLQGAPFKFRLGKKEVINGWDSGLVGMKVGGKRRLTVPPQQGYGKQRQGPIPPNSTLVFDIELKSVS